MLEFLESIVRDYGYLALFIGTFLEGETILLVAGFLAQSGHLDLWLCILAAFSGSLSGDQAAFYVGRFKGKKFVDSRPAWKSRVERIHQMLERFHEALILSFRFFYGLRNLTPFILGTTEIPGLKFFVLNAIGAAIWAIVFAYAGYFFGTVVASVLKDIHHIEMIILGVAVAVGALVWYLKWRKRRKENAARLAAEQEMAVPQEMAASDAPGEEAPKSE